jgi:hypothetical protein
MFLLAKSKFILLLWFLQYFLKQNTVLKNTEQARYLPILFKVQSRFSKEHHLHLQAVDYTQHEENIPETKQEILCGKDWQPTNLFKKSTRYFGSLRASLFYLLGYIWWQPSAPSINNG